ncbi:MAG: diphosphomevalonate decarboxylase [Myxococcota bacterium]|nr:diphosphomevalonate decarboxylase [Myxococcota bacterium]
MSEAIAEAHPNVALSKYWGKRPGGGNYPAVPSLSVTLAGLTTRTRVRFDESLVEDCLCLHPDGALENAEDRAERAAGKETVGEPRRRVVELLDRVRHAAGERRRAEIQSQNDFPTASGLASSASGFAALALAAVRAAGLDWDATRVSDLARRSSASAARSLFGGFVELPAAAEAPSVDCVLAAEPLAPCSHLPLAIIVGVTTAGHKSIGSTEGMRRTLDQSPYARAWLREAPRLHRRLREALLAGDFQTVGELSEASALAMHASAIAAGVMYWNGGTLEALKTVAALRRSGTLAYATIDAGPHVKVLTRPDDSAVVGAALKTTRGVMRVIEAFPGEGARLAAAGDREVAS